MSFKTAVVECVLGHNIDKKYEIQKKSMKRRKRCFILDLKQTVLHEKILVLVFKQAIHLKSTWCMKYKLLGNHDTCGRSFCLKNKNVLNI